MFHVRPNCINGVHCGNIIYLMGSEARSTARRCDGSYDEEAGFNRLESSDAFNGWFHFAIFFGSGKFAPILAAYYLRQFLRH